MSIRFSYSLLIALATIAAMLPLTAFGQTNAAGEGLFSFDQKDSPSLDIDTLWDDNLIDDSLWLDPQQRRNERFRNRWPLDGQEDRLTSNQQFLEPWNDGVEDRQNGSFSVRGQSQKFGNFSLRGSGSAKGGALMLGHGYQGEGWLKNYGARLESDRFSTLLTIGATAKVMDLGPGIVAANVQAGYDIRHIALSDSVHVSADIWHARPISCGRHWIKLGAFVDQEEEIGKLGPALGLLWNADSATPLTLDIAWGLGTGARRLFNNNANLIGGADHDIQIRAGAMLGPWNVGATAQYLHFNGFVAASGWEGGGFVRFPFSHGHCGLELTTGPNGTRGMANVSLYPGSFATSSINRSVASRSRSDVVVLGQGPTTPDWVFNGFNRSRQIRTNDVALNGGANNVCGGVAFFCKFSDAVEIGGNDNETVGNLDTGIEVTICVQSFDGEMHSVDIPDPQVVAPGETATFFIEIDGAFLAVVECTPNTGDAADGTQVPATVVDCIEEGDDEDTGGDEGGEDL